MNTEEQWAQRKSGHRRTVDTVTVDTVDTENSGHGGTVVT